MQEVAELKAKRDKLERELAAKKVELAEMETLYPEMAGSIRGSVYCKKKMMLRTIINGIIVYRDRVEMTFKLRISQFIDAMGRVESKGVKSPDVAQYGKVLTHSSLAGSPVYKQA